MEFQSNLNNLRYFLRFLEKFGKMSRDVRDKMHGGCNCESNLNQTKNLNFKKHSPLLLLTSKTLYCHQHSADFT